MLETCSSHCSAHRNHSHLTTTVFDTLLSTNVQYLVIATSITFKETMAYNVFYDT